MSTKLEELTDNELRSIEDRLQDMSVQFGGVVFDTLLATRFVVAEELSRRGYDEGAVRLVRDHCGHQVWTDEDGSAVMCDCGWAVNGLPSVAAADQEGESHIAETGGRWDRSMMEGSA